MQSLDLTVQEVMDFTGWPFEMANDYVSRSSDYMTVGTGTPEGSVPANRSRQYFDSDSEQLYINPVVGSRVGWIAI